MTESQGALVTGGRIRRHHQGRVKRFMRRTTNHPLRFHLTVTAFYVVGVIVLLLTATPPQHRLDQTVVAVLYLGLINFMMWLMRQ